MNTFADIYSVYYKKNGKLVHHGYIHVYLGMVDSAAKRYAEENKIDYDDFSVSFQYTES
jgi:hypothetical protein